MKTKKCSFEIYEADGQVWHVLNAETPQEMIKKIKALIYLNPEIQDEKL